MSVYREAGQSDLSVPASYIAADSSSFHSAFVEIVERRRAGESVGLIPLVEHPRRRLLKSIVKELAGNTSYDVLLERLHAFARGQIAVNNVAQKDVEATYTPPSSAISFQHATLCADRVVFRSVYEAELAAQLFGVRPADYTICATKDRTVPLPIAANTEGHLAIWIAESDKMLAELVSRLTSDIPLKSVIVKPSPEASQLLASSRAIVCTSDDPGTAIALAAFGKPLSAATPGAGEYLTNVQTFDIWDPASTIDAIQRSLGAPSPVVRDCASADLPDPRRTIPFGDDPPLVSVVMTVFDRLRHLEENLERLQHQTYPNVEVIVVSNNGPRADEICAKFSNVRYIHRAENSGAAGETRNDGIAAARGVYIMALDDDDILFDDHIAAMVHACENGADAVYSDFLIQIVEPRDDGDYLLGYDIEVGTAITAHELMVQNRLGYMTVFARRAVYDAFPVAYDQINVRGASEVELWLRMARKFAFAKASRPTTLYTIRKNWQGSVTAVHHFMFADGYEKMYEMYPASGLPRTEERRIAHLASLRSAQQAPSRGARYIVPKRRLCNSQEADLPI